ncbi:MAG: transcriptional repressor LexA [Lentisphaerae bacterium]|jgi:repressor LexA|nr:transcriptional repressor LexA [Lentisphaerota bacterium]
MKGLTTKQQDILDFIAEFARREGMAPTISEISEHCKIKSATAFAHIRALQRKGYVNRSSKARSLTLVNAPKPTHFSLTLSIPVLGRISAGAPLLSEQHIEGQIHFDPALLPRSVGGHNLFALKVQGESMRDLGILDGDIIIAKQTETASLGDIVVAMMDGETTVKSLHLTEGKWELRPANPDFKSRFYPLDELTIQGVVVALQRTF